LIDAYDTSGAIEPIEWLVMAGIIRREGLLKCYSW